MGESQYYIVRGACMACEYGSHKRKLNLPVSHGAFVKDRPMMNEDDYGPDNISYFGICQNPDNPSTETIYLVSEEGQQISGKPCKPIFPEKWNNTKETTRVEGKPALTSESYQQCMYMGYVGFMTTGQEDE
ncbi:hypothetical protein D1872_269190 [compost metagenome]